MDPSYKHLDKDTLNELLEVYRRNLGVLEVQAAKHGSAYVPLVIAHSIRESKSKIEAIEKELYKYEPNTVTEKQSPKILVIDDDATFREEIVSMLSDEDFVIVEASNGIEGLKLAEVEQPDITLLDIEMPEVDGYTVLAQIVEKRIRTRVLIISAYDNRVSTLIRAGACDFISKIDIAKKNLITSIRRSLLLDYTVDVILDNPVKIISPLIERLEISYKKESAQKKAFGELIRNIGVLFSQLKGNTSIEILGIVDLINIFIDESSLYFEMNSTFLEEERPFIRRNMHDIRRSLMIVRSRAWSINKKDLSSDENSKLYESLHKAIDDALRIGEQLYRYSSMI